MPDNTVAQKRPSYKLYVEVGVVYTPDGAMYPKYIRLNHRGEILVIDKILHRQRAASRKAGGCGICYTVQIKGQEARLFYEDAPKACRWFVETKQPVYIND